MKSETISYSGPLQPIAPDGRIGVVTLATDINIEQDLRRIYPTTVEMFTSRILNVNPLTIDNLRLMAPRISATAETILPGTPLDAVIYACTSGTVAIGVDRVEQLIQESCPGVPVTNPVTASLDAFNLFGAKKISILTPYSEAVNSAVAIFFQSQGYEVINIAGFGFEDDTLMSFITPEDISRAAINTCDPQADLLFISCTALRASLAIDDIEKQLGIPVVSSNQALAWHSLRIVGYKEPISGFGALLTK